MYVTVSINIYKKYYFQEVFFPKIKNYKIYYYKYTNIKNVRSKLSNEKKA